MRRSVMPLLGLLALLLLNPPAVLASPFETPDRATISGPGIAGEWDITEPNLLATLQFHTLDDQAIRGRETTTAPVSGEPYLLTRYMKKYDGTLFVVDRLQYYQGQNGEPGRFFYEAVGYTGSPYSGKWLVAMPSEDSTFAGLLAKLSVEQPAALPATGGTAGMGGWVIVLAALAALLLGITLRRFRPSCALMRDSPSRKLALESHILVQATSTRVGAALFLVMVGDT
jgi:hypothetical protein